MCVLVYPLVMQTSDERAKAEDGLSSCVPVRTGTRQRRGKHRPSTGPGLWRRPPVGTDLRKAVLDGFPPERMVAYDLYMPCRFLLLQSGRRLFCIDEAQDPVRFVAGDILQGAQPLSELYGACSTIHAGYFFHLFDEDDQRRLAHIISRLMQARRGTTVLGSQLGRPRAGRRVVPLGGRAFVHSPESWSELWCGPEGPFDESQVIVSAVLQQPNPKDLMADSVDVESDDRALLIWSVVIR
ncbi:hypothetical protein FA95DRAFT_1567318 [Auriscalpium vulgare]|uniref:Uncharacterized protein n=1 Tax=Auriscalpium vulgare TaxID=40419 RepID=A0ACB8R6E8_9AGAM|nr:hypothetical protein FA95DRAFT_1567318 [Auriscalpium vulgare]